MVGSWEDDVLEAVKVEDGNVVEDPLSEAAYAWQPVL